MILWFTLHTTIIIVIINNCHLLHYVLLNPTNNSKDILICSLSSKLRGIGAHFLSVEFKHGSDSRIFWNTRHKHRSYVMSKIPHFTSPRRDVVQSMFITCYWARDFVSIINRLNKLKSIGTLCFPGIKLPFGTTQCVIPKGTTHCVVPTYHVDNSVFTGTDRG